MKFFGFGFIAFGLMFSLPLLTQLSRTWSVLGNEHTTGVVIQSIPGRRPVLLFRDTDGRSVVVREREAPKTARQLADRVPITYPTDDPLAARIGGPEWGASAAFLLLVSAFLAVGGGIIAFGVRLERRARWLITHGQKLTLPVREVARDIRENDSGRRSYWHIIAQRYDRADDSYAVYQSRRLEYDPSGTVRPGDLVTVHVDPADPTRYWMQTPKQTVRT